MKFTNIEEDIFKEFLSSNTRLDNQGHGEVDFNDSSFVIEC